MYLGDIVETSNTADLFKNPKHPYTKALLEALPNKRGNKLKNINSNKVADMTLNLKATDILILLLMVFSSRLVVRLFGMLHRLLVLIIFRVKLLSYRVLPN